MTKGRVGSAAKDSVARKLALALAAGLKVGLCGSSGSGKTTFAKTLKDKCAAQVHEEGVREWMTANNWGDYSEIDDVAFSELHLHLLRRYSGMASNVYDRTPVDLFFYARERARFLSLSELETKCREYTNCLHAIVLFPFHMPYLVADFGRVCDPGEQIRTAGMMMGLIKDWGFKDRLVVFDHHATLEVNFEALIGRFELRRLE